MLKDSPTAFTRVAADFNGDSIGDIALLLKSTQGNAEALWVFMSAPEPSGWLLLNVISWPSEHADTGLSMRIDKAEPGVHACPDEGSGCETDPTSGESKLTLTNPGIEYFRLGSSASVFYWSHIQGKFLQVWISD